MIVRCVTFICVAALPADVSSDNADTPSIGSKLERARHLFMQGYYDSAIEAYSPLCEAASTRLAATLGIVACYELQGRYAEGLELLDTVRSIGLESADWHVAVAGLHRRTGKYREAIDAYRRASEHDESHMAARLGLGDAYEILGEKKKALEVYAWFDALLRARMPERADELTLAARGLYRHAWLSMHPRLTERTRYVLHELLQPAYEKIDRTYWPARLASAELLLSKYNKNEAKADFAAARSLNNNLPDAYVGLGRLALDGWDFDTAERPITSARCNSWPKSA
jgi:TPR repeat protein